MHNPRNQFLDEIGLADPLQLTGVFLGGRMEFFRAFALANLLPRF